jgi:hypothetical protein
MVRPKKEMLRSLTLLALEDNTNNHSGNATLKKDFEHILWVVSHLHNDPRATEANLKERFSELLMGVPVRREYWEVFR